MIPDITKYPYIALDTETTGLQYLRDEVFGLSISTPDGQDFYWDIRHHPVALSILGVLAVNPQIKVIMANASFDIRMLKGRINPEQADDVIIRAALIDGDLPSYSLDYLGEKYLKKRKVDIIPELQQIFGGPATRNVQMKNLHRAPVDLVAEYAKRDTRLTLDLWEWQEREIERQGIREIVEFERKLMPVVIRTEMAGIRVDEAYAEKAMAKMTPIIERDQKHLNSLVGFDVNVNSSPQIKKIFQPRRRADGTWETVDGHPLESTKKGGPSIDATALRSMDNPVAKLILDIRSNLKTRDTFLKKHVLEHAINGRVYPSINQTKGERGGTYTGRFSYTDPAMQQIPSRNKEVAAIVKPCFLPDEGQVWVDADMASFEVRVFASPVGDPVILDEYQRNPALDLHQYVADLTGLPRNARFNGDPNAKQLNLSAIFCQGDGATAEKMGMEWSWETFTTARGEVVRYKAPGPEARKVIENYHRRIPGVRKLAERAQVTARRFGYVKTFLGRKIRFPDKRFLYKASGLLIQATAADLNKENWLICDEVLPQYGGRLVLNTHDSYSMSLPEDQWERAYKELEKEICKDGRLRVPLVMDLSGVGKNWWEAIK